VFTETVESQDVPSAAVENESPSETPVTENQQSSESASAE